MKPELQRIAIAEACGAKWHSVLVSPKTEHLVLALSRWTDLGPGRWELMDGRVLSSDVPDYLNDLNAMHEAEKVLTPTQQGQYAIILAGGHGRLSCLFALANKTAAQRAEAFLKTLNLYTP